MSDREYQRLTAKALGGDKNSAETLARLWYQYSDDNSKVVYWLEVAARNGSQRAERFAQVAKSRMQ